MHLFILHKCPERAARMLCDQHVADATLKTAQILCTAATLLIDELLALNVERAMTQNVSPKTYCDEPAELRALQRRIPYARLNEDHPCVHWAKSSYSNWYWVVRYGFELIKEVRFRFGQDHGSSRVIQWCYRRGPRPRDIGRTPYVLCLPDQYKSLPKGNAIQAYRAWYQAEEGLQWARGRERPGWWKRSPSATMGPEPEPGAHQ